MTDRLFAELSPGSLARGRRRTGGGRVSQRAAKNGDGGGKREDEENRGTASLVRRMFTRAFELEKRRSMGIAPTHVSPAPLEQQEPATRRSRRPRADAPSGRAAARAGARRPGRALRRRVVGATHPIRVFLVAALAGYALLVGLTIAAGLPADESHPPDRRRRVWDEHVNRWLARARTPTRVDLSWVGSTLAGGIVIPILVGVLLVLFLCFRHWRLAAFTLFVICIESGTYRATSLVVHRDRPDVDRLETLPVNASYPSGHTAASVALFAGLLLVLASRIESLAVRLAALVARGRDSGFRDLVADAARHAPPHRRHRRRADGHRRARDHRLRVPGGRRCRRPARRRRKREDRPS